MGDDQENERYETGQCEHEECVRVFERVIHQTDVQDSIGGDRCPFVAEAWQREQTGAHEDEDQQRTDASEPNGLPVLVADEIVVPEHAQKNREVQVEECENV